MAPATVILDTDPGIDDALALLLAARWRERCLLDSVTVVYGNTTIEFAARNARHVLERAHCAARVLPGADRPLVRELYTARETHGPEGLGDHRLPPPEPVSPSHGALRDAIRAAPGPVTLVTLGPLTNLAHALAIDAPLVRRKVAAHFMMGGTFEARGTMGPRAEFNVWCDPEAADRVLRAGLPTRIVGMDVTRQLAIPARSVALLAHHPDEEARWLGSLLGFYVRFHEQEEGMAAAVINDPLAVALALEPDWGAAEPVPVAVDLTDGPDRGRTSIGDADAGDPTVLAYRSFDAERVHELLLDHVFGRWLTRNDFVL